MLFSFFVAVMLTPWLMLKVVGRAGGPHPGAAHAAGDHGRLGRIYVRAVSPIVKSKARAWTFLLVVGLATLGSLALIYTKHVTVKLLPFDNKSERQGLVDLPEGSSIETTDRVLQDAELRLAALPEIVSIQSHAGAAAPFNLNGLVRHSYLRSSPEMGDLQVNLEPAGQRRRTSHEVALQLTEMLRPLDRPAGTSVKVVEPPPGPPVMATLLAEIYGPDAATAHRNRSGQSRNPARSRPSPGRAGSRPGSKPMMSWQEGWTTGRRATNPRRLEPDLDRM